MTEQEQIIGTIKRVMPAVVSIAISKKLEEVEKEIPRDIAPLLPFHDGHLQVPDEMMEAGGMVKIGGGSGFIVDETGIIVTNKHVVADANAEYSVILDDGQKMRAEVLARDPMDDVAILKTETNAARFPVVKLGDSNETELGETVLAIGNALGMFKNTVSRGIVSGLARSIRAATEDEQNKKRPMLQELRGLIQTDAAINPGNSGGPLVNLYGEAIAINAAIVFGAQNLGFAIPINAVKRDLADLKKHGRIIRPLLGVRYLMVDPRLKEKMHLPVDQGALVMGDVHRTAAVIPGSPADKAGIKMRDIITAVSGEPVTAEKTIQDFLETREVGDVLTLTVSRADQTLQIPVTLAERK